MLDAGIEVMIYAGVDDLICNWLGNYRWVNALPWNGAKAWAASDLRPWLVDGSVAGEVRQAQGLTFVKVHAAGHMVPMVCPLFEYVSMLMHITIILRPNPSWEHEVRQAQGLTFVKVHAAAHNVPMLSCTQADHAAAVQYVEDGHLGPAEAPFAARTHPLPPPTWPLQASLSCAVKQPSIAGLVTLRTVNDTDAFSLLRQAAGVWP